MHRSKEKFTCKFKRLDVQNNHGIDQTLKSHQKLKATRDWDVTEKSNILTSEQRT